MIGEGDIALVVGDADMTVCGHLVGLLVVGDRVGEQDASATVDLDMAVRGDDLVVAVIIDLVGLQQALALDRRLAGAPCAGGGSDSGTSTTVAAPEEARMSTAPSSVLLMEDEGHADQDGGDGRRGRGQRDRQDAGLAERVGEVAEEIDAEARKRAEQDHPRQAAAARDKRSEKLAAMNTIAANSAGRARVCRDKADSGWPRNPAFWAVRMKPRQFPERQRVGRREAFLDLCRRQRRGQLVVVVMRRGCRPCRSPRHPSASRRLD